VYAMFRDGTVCMPSSAACLLAISCSIIKTIGP
jgi:hypothetical protein